LVTLVEAAVATVMKIEMISGANAEIATQADVEMSP
jgi:hypothetical protein